MSPPALQHRTAELAVAAAALLFGVVVMIDSWRIGARWADDGPQAGYFPFYMGLIVGVSSGWTLVRALMPVRRITQPDPARTFLTRHQAMQIFALLLPLTIFLAAIAPLGIYVSSVLFIAYFMTRHGAHRWWSIAAVALLVPLVLFMMFEVWFSTPLPKGPLEALLGLN